jgi:predicted  nucleic acid-binding Zn ribbon protein
MIPQEELARFGYKLKMKIKFKTKILLYFRLYTLNGKYGDLYNYGY